jgi:hypothetical protein
MYRSLRTNRDSRATLQVYDHARYEQIGGTSVLTCEDEIMFPCIHNKDKSRFAVCRCQQQRFPRLSVNVRLQTRQLLPRSFGIQRSPRTMVQM